MLEITGILLGLVFLLGGCYLVLNIYLNRYDLPILHIEKLLGKKKEYKILAIDPHPDDETMTSGGFLSKFGEDQRVDIKHICITKGEKGDELLKITEAELAKTREMEYNNAIEILGVDSYEIWNFQDGQIDRRIEQIKKKLFKEVNKFSPDLILVYERAGLYGHPDHIALTSLVYDVVNSEVFSKQKKIKILYKTLPKNVLKHMKLPLHMANGKKIEQAPPIYRLPVWQYLFQKYRAVKQHKSQNLTHGKPLWLLMLLFNNEYFTDKY